MTTAQEFFLILANGNKFSQSEMIKQKFIDVCQTERKREGGGEKERERKRKKERGRERERAKNSLDPEKT